MLLVILGWSPLGAFAIAELEDRFSIPVQNEGLKVGALLVVGPTVVIHGERPGGAFLAIASPMHVLKLASFASGLGEAQGSPLAIARIRKGLTGRCDAPEFPCFLVEVGCA